MTALIISWYIIGLICTAGTLIDMVSDLPRQHPAKRHTTFTIVLPLFAMAGPAVLFVLPLRRAWRRITWRFRRMRPTCNLGVGCEEYGGCYAEAHNEPWRCGRLP